MRAFPKVQIGEIVLPLTKGGDPEPASASVQGMNGLLWREHFQWWVLDR